MGQTDVASDLVFTAILPEEIQWTDLPSLPKAARLADIVERGFSISVSVKNSEKRISGHAPALQAP